MTQGGRSLELARLPSPRLARQSPAWLARVLGGIRFGAVEDSSQAPELCAPSIPIALLADDQGFCELWRTTEQPLELGARGPVRYRRGTSLLFGYIRGSEDELSIPFRPGVSAPPLQRAAETAYRKIFECLEALGFPAVARFWNYFPKINRVTHGIERYRQFNIGRQNAFLAWGRTVIDAAPPACALGCSAERCLSVAFLATNHEVASIGNPRQVDAFHYPQRYGPRSPTFSRAGLLELEGQKSLFVSGTSSIVGHETLHIGDAAAQTRETLSNIEAVVAAANQVAGRHSFDMSELRYNAYVRRPGDLRLVRSQIASKIGTDAQVTYLQADICRADLLVEVEAFGEDICAS
jgi:chorismate lyase/3-hydroxybenzoate synthase